MPQSSHLRVCSPVLAVQLQAGHAVPPAERQRRHSEEQVGAEPEHAQGGALLGAHEGEQGLQGREGEDGDAQLRVEGVGERLEAHECDGNGGRHAGEASELGGGGDWVKRRKSNGGDENE